LNRWFLHGILDCCLMHHILIDKSSVFWCATCRWSGTLHIIMYVCLQIQMQIQESAPSPKCYTMQCTLPCELTRPFPSLVEPACYSKFIIHAETQVQYESQCWLATLAIWCYISVCWYLYLAPWDLQVLHYTLTILMLMQRQAVMNTALISVQNIVVNHLNLPDRVVNTVAWHRWWWLLAMKIDICPVLLTSR